jgi:Membrane carboxypeptidase (penicillin-binding protein)
LAKNLYPRDRQQATFIPLVKLKEMCTAHRKEHIYSKDDMLTLYKDKESCGENTFGIERAAQKDFSTSATDLTILKAATLIGMAKGMGRYKSGLHSEKGGTTVGTR